MKHSTKSLIETILTKSETILSIQTFIKSEYPFTPFMVVYVKSEDRVRTHRHLITLEIMSDIVNSEYSICEKVITNMYKLLLYCDEDNPAQNDILKIQNDIIKKYPDIALKVELGG